MPETRIATTDELLQKALNDYGYLDPPIDGNFGPVSRWALSEVYQRAGKVYTVGDIPTDALSVVKSTKRPEFHFAKKPTLADRVAKAYIKNGYWFSTHPDCVNISYIEGMELDGTPNDNRPNVFNDIRLVWQISDLGEPVLLDKWEGTTEPGKYWTDNPMSPKGAARIKFGLYKAWGVGMHHTHEALVQVEDVTVCRDLNRDYKRAGDKEDTGQFGINQHWGYDLKRGDLSTSSAGCLVGRLKEGHKKFMSIVKSDARYQASRGYHFMTAIFPANDIPA